ncbi:MAG: hypothetical protein ABI843_12360, partial [Dokdonella sp.]
MATKIPTTLVGHKLRFSFTDGPMAGKAFDHTFHKNGSVEFGPPGGPTTESKHAIVAKVADGFFLASYLGPKGYTLTVGIDAAGGKLVAISSDGKDWSKQVGYFELV